ncbi:UvrD-helicase domain-containing protein [Streptomyces alkaliphilus]|uniref:UvrD-helicase domain-containing protein n=1 Tax=Streptomyces alkaliphilus TaxID=1472722 RepID=UPI00117CB72F|nr:UvrD-helicase domain-containing protein [Streptomyces alkaliphilus]MQS06350.1 AAA family ATPase [Streptomyces alkaliphilus]
MSDPTPRPATLRLLDRADREIAELDADVIGAVYRFQHGFRKNPHPGGFDLKQVKGHDRLWSARVTREYRALLLRLGEDDWLLVAVKHRREVHRGLDRYAYGINRVTGAIDYVDLRRVEEGVLSRADPDAAVPTGSPTEPPAAPAEAAGTGGTGEPGTRTGDGTPRPLFADHTPEALRGLGVAESLLPVIARLTDPDDLPGLVAHAPRHTGEVLLRLYDGVSAEQVRREIVDPIAPTAHDAETAPPADAGPPPGEPPATTPATDPDSAWQAAIARSDAVVLTDDASLERIIEEKDFGRWKIFLHPTQERLVRRELSGPARVGGGPGTGKTIVALHRVRHLVARLPPGNTRPVLLTTFNRNLAADLRARLLALGGPQTVSRVDIVHVDQLANRVVGEAEPGNTRRRIDDARALAEWRDMLAETDETRWSPEFLADEWNQVILGQAVTSRSDYFRARRAGRGRSLTRPERAAVWQLAERFTQRLETARLETHRQVAERAARLEMARAARIGERARRDGQRDGPGNIHVESATGARQRHRYRHIVVDEAQDLAPAHWKMLRAMAPHAPNDLFVVGDTHQRIYDNQVTLGSLGINIRGRSSRLTLSYRTTREILRSALLLLEGTDYDDLDGGPENLAGYRSVLHGRPPTLIPAADWDEELDAVTEQVRAWHGVPRESVAVCVPTNGMADDVMARLARRGIPAARITPDGVGPVEGVHIGTMYRFKGLEYRCVIIAGLSEGRVPRSPVDQWEHIDADRYRRELQRARSLLFVAATRARDALTLTWHGEPSRFLGPLLAPRPER